MSDTPDKAPKPYGYEVRCGVVEIRWVGYDAPPSDQLTLYHIGTEHVVKRWARQQVRTVRGKKVMVVTIDALKALSKEEYQAIQRQNKGWPAVLEPRKETV